jgi:drug/metabolite transporter (DMT)-like permease
MLGIGLGLCAALSWGVADFVGGVQARRLPVALLMLISQAVAFALVCCLVIALGLPSQNPTRLLASAAVGVLIVCTLFVFYRALAVGKMSIVAPVSATGAALPVIVGIVSGERPSPLQVAGIAAAVVGVVLASRQDGPEHERVAARESFGLALLSACGAGTVLVLMHHAAAAGVMWTLVVSRASLVLTLVVMVAVRPGLARRREGGREVPVLETLGGPGGRARVLVPTLATLAGLGLLDVAGAGFYAAASRHGLLSITAVAAALFPLATVGLARAVLGERVARVQELGIGVALAGVVMLAAG